jgi:hypothetical protein
MTPIVVEGFESETSERNEMMNEMSQKIEGKCFQFFSRDP